MDKACSTHGEKENAYRILVGKLEGKSPPARSRNKSENIKMDLRETERDGMDWIYLAQDRGQ
jgi:hypothetical protein